MKEQILIVEDEFIVAHDLQRILEKDGYRVQGIADSVKKAMTLIEQQKPDLVLLDIYLKGKMTGIDLAKQLMLMAIPFIYVSANSNERVLEAAKATQPYGFIVKPYRDHEVLLSIDIARYRAQYSTNFKLSGELYIQGIIEHIFRNTLSWEQKILRMVSAFQPYIPFDFVAVVALDKARQYYNDISILRTQFEEYEVIDLQQFIAQAGITLQQYQALYMATPGLVKEVIYTGDDFITICQSAPLKQMLADIFYCAANLVKAVELPNGDTIMFSFYSKIADVYTQEHLDLLHHLTPTLTAHLPGILHSRKPTGITEQAPAAALSFRNETNPQFEGLVGNSTLLLQVLDQMKVVANTDTSVLITGESGTGKEIVAANLHRLSPRRLKPMVTINCAALPVDLVESILFGHEKGAFTGANEARIGKFEEANGSTIFLDEIGEMPFELQSKLLRVLQEKEIERIGGQAPIAVDLRIIAATNRNLEREIALGKFRLDLYYRLNVFPIHLPPLRERREDIPALVAHFISLYAKKLRKGVTHLAQPVLNELLTYHWPGNVRELEHLMERSVLRTTQPEITENFLGVEIVPLPNPEKHNAVFTIAENERNHIIDVLKKCHGKIAGEGGAADLLGIPASTLNSKMKKLGIKR